MIRGNRIKAVWRALALVAATPAMAAAESLPPYEPLDSAVILEAAEGWESDETGEFYVRGGLSLRTDLWTINADSARVAGPLENPELIVVDGAPATITLHVDDQSSAAEPVQAEGRHLEFAVPDNSLQLDGHALLRREGQSVTSEHISYLIDRDLFSAGSYGRVKVITEPKRAE